MGQLMTEAPASVPGWENPHQQSRVFGYGERARAPAPEPKVVPLSKLCSEKEARTIRGKYFLADERWTELMDGADFDYVVIGSSCTAGAFIEETLRLNPLKRILCLERGDFWLPSHFQNLLPPTNVVRDRLPESPLWASTAANAPELGYCHGACPYFGGKSLLWAGWSPRPSPEQMRDFPPQLVEATQTPGFWDRAEAFLNVSSARDLYCSRFGMLQDQVEDLMGSDGAEAFTGAARLAGGRNWSGSGPQVRKFSAAEPILELLEKDRHARSRSSRQASLEIMLNCTVSKICCEGKEQVVQALETTRGRLRLVNPKTKVILCTGAIPNATILMNSFQSLQPSLGTSISGHFRSQLVFRVPVSCLKGFEQENWEPRERRGLQLAAHCLAGRANRVDEHGQYHIQTLGYQSPQPERDMPAILREGPNYGSAPRMTQLKGSEEHYIFALTSLGELSEENPNSWLRLDPAVGEPSRNVNLQFTLTDADRRLWDVMDAAMFRTVCALAKDESAVEYWSSKHQVWMHDRPITDDLRATGVVHETGTARIGAKGEGGSLDEFFRPHGQKNVFVTGTAALPTAGSWNPTLTICGFSQYLARNLNQMDINEQQ